MKYKIFAQPRSKINSYFHICFDCFKYVSILTEFARLTGGVGVLLYTEIVFSGGDGRVRRIRPVGSPHGDHEVLSCGAGGGEQMQPEGGIIRLDYRNRVRP